MTIHLLLVRDLYRLFTHSPLLHVVLLTQLFRKYFLIALDTAACSIVIKAFIIDVGSFVTIYTLLDRWELMFAVVVSTYLTTVGHALTLWPSTGDFKSTKVTTT